MKAQDGSRNIVFTNRDKFLTVSPIGLMEALTPGFQINYIFVVANSRRFSLIGTQEFLKSDSLVWSSFQESGSVGIGFPASPCQ